VAIATPAAPHREMAEAAAQQGCHIICDKPLATNAAEARAMLRAVERAGVKHAYGATSRYAPAVKYARTLLAEGLIGQVREIESIGHFYFSPLLTHTWFHQLSQGGGALNNVFTHKLAQVLHATDGTMHVAAGEARRLLDRAPVGVTIHDFREFFGPTALVEPAQAAAGEWRAVDVDTAYTVLTQLQLPNGQRASALFQLSDMATSPYPEYLAFYGTQGTLVLTGPNAPDRIQRFDLERQAWEDVPIPQTVITSLPQIEDGGQRDWNQLFREFVADVRGAGYMGYPTFHDGWVCAEIIEIVRSGRSWAALPEHPDDSGQ
jgi:predicted dehydrogenase